VQSPGVYKLGLFATCSDNEAVEMIASNLGQHQREEDNATTGSHVCKPISVSTLVKEKRITYKGAWWQVRKFEGCCEKTMSVHLCSEHQIRACTTAERGNYISDEFKEVIESGGDRDDWLCPKTEPTC